MKATEFCYWLQGYFELTQQGLNYGSPSLHTDQVKCIQDHLLLVFIHDIDPSYPQEQQAALNAVHNGESLVKEPEKVMRC